MYFYRLAIFLGFIHESMFHTLYLGNVGSRSDAGERAEPDEERDRTVQQSTAHGSAARSAVSGRGLLLVRGDPLAAGGCAGGEDSRAGRNQWWG